MPYDKKNFFGSTNYDPTGPKQKPAGYGLRPDRANLDKKQDSSAFRQVDQLRWARTPMPNAPVKDAEVQSSTTGKRVMKYKPGKG
jgi:hypothetical protein